MEEYTSDISIIDVYELASVIGKEFEKIIDSYGTEVVSNLMPRVINALEHLESLATKNERENVILDDLKNRIVKLEYDKHARAEDRVKYEKELEQIEEDWRKESSHLLNVISKLQDENKRLSSIVANQSYDQDSALGSEIDVDVVYQLQNQVDQTREKVKLQSNEINTKNDEIENLQNEVEHLNSTVLDLRRKQKLHSSQITGFIDERTKLLIEIQDHRRELHLLHQRLGMVQQENDDLAKSSVEVPDLRNKVLYDIDDPDRPRFTTSELKEILHERNELKSKLNELQDELAVFRTENSIDASELASELEYSGEEELPVQGPLPLEPDDAPWKKQPESGIRRLFRKFILGDQSPSPARRFPKSSFSSKASSSSSPTSSTFSNI